MTPVVNAHTHLDATWLESVRPDRPQPFPRWLQRYIRRGRLLDRRPNAEERRFAGVEQGIEALHQAGTTHVGDVTASGLSIEPLLASGLSGVIYIEILGLEVGVGDFMFQRAVQLLDRYRSKERSGMRLGFTTHAAYSVRPETFEQVAAFCLAESIPLAVHVAEHPAENECLVHGRGDLWEMPRRIAGPQASRPHRPGKRVIPYLNDLGILDCKPQLIHMVDVTDEELDLVAQSGAKVIHCPRSNHLLDCGRMPLEKFLSRNIPLGLGTDSLASSPSLDIQEEAAFAYRLHEKMVPRIDIDEMVENPSVF